MSTLVLDNDTSTIISAPIATEHKPWEHQPYETYQWYTRFLNCYLMQPRYSRSVTQAYKNYRIEKGNISEDKLARVNAPSRIWAEAFHQYNWDSRALAYDMHINDLLLSNIEENAKQSKANRINVLDMMLASVAQYYAEGEIKYDAGTANATLKTAIRELREEYQPTHKHDNRTQVLAFIGQLQPNLQSALRGVLKKATD